MSGRYFMMSEGLFYLLDASLGVEMPLECLNDLLRNAKKAYLCFKQNCLLWTPNNRSYCAELRSNQV